MLVPSISVEMNLLQADETTVKIIVITRNCIFDFGGGNATRSPNNWIKDSLNS